MSDSDQTSSASSWQMQKTCEKCKESVLIDEENLKIDIGSTQQVGYTRLGEYFYVFCNHCDSVVRIEVEEVPKEIRSRIKSKSFGKKKTKGLTFKKS